MKTFTVWIAIAALGLGCSSVISKEDPARALSRDEESIVEADNSFGLRLFRALSSKSDAPLCVSPLSISMALGMTLNGAAGATRDSMARTLALQGLTSEQINTAYRSLSSLMSVLDPSVQFSIANSIWHRSDVEIEQEFIDANTTYFDAVTAPLDGRAVDAWVEKKTMGKIKKIAPDPIPGNLLMLLINAIYFKGIWTSRFDAKDTRDDTFLTIDEKSVPVKMMYQNNAKLRQYRNGEMKMVELPYGNGTFSMVIALPEGEQTLDGLISSLDSRTWTTWMSQLREGEGKLYLPRFSVEWAGALGTTLKALGMGLAFSEGAANFSRINPTLDIWIGEVQHKTFVEVNEEGAEAAAATSVEMMYDSYSPDAGFVMRVDRPFLFAIRDSRTGSIFFIGKVTEL